jgi:hypothetical protein
MKIIHLLPLLVFSHVLATQTDKNGSTLESHSSQHHCPRIPKAADGLPRGAHMISNDDEAKQKQEAKRINEIVHHACKNHPTLPIECSLCTEDKTGKENCKPCPKDMKVTCDTENSGTDLVQRAVHSSNVRGNFALVLRHGGILLWNILYIGTIIVSLPLTIPIICLVAMADMNHRINRHGG